MRRGSARQGLWAVLLVVAACRAGSGLPAPTLSAIDPPRGFNGADLAVTITGTDFYRKATQSLESGTSEVDATYRAFLGPTELTGVLRKDDAHLTATIPAGLAEGTYFLLVQGPYGSAMLPEAYAATAIHPAGLSASLAAPAQVGVDEDFALTLTVTNSGGGAASAVAPSAPQLTGAGAIALVSGPAPASADLATGASQDFVYQARGQALGALTVDIDVSASDVDGTPLATSAQASLTVRGTTNLSGAPSASATTVAVGDTFTAGLRVTNNGTAAASGVTASLSLVGDGAADTTDPVAQDIGAGAQTDFQWTLLAKKAGAATLRFSAHGTDPGGDPVLMNPVELPIVIQALPKLTISIVATPARVNVGQTIDVELDAFNDGAVVLTAVTPSISLSGIGTAAIATGPYPSAGNLSPVDSLGFSYTLVAQSAGVLEIDASATASDSNTGLPVSSASGTFVTIQRRSNLVATLTAPAQARIGGTFDVRLDLTDDGDSDALSVAPSLLVLGGTASGSITFGPAPSGSVPVAAGAAAVSFLWTVTTTTGGPLTLTVHAAGLDALDGLPVTSPDAVATCAIVTAASLSATLVAPPLVAPGAEYPVSLVVANSGGADASAVTPSAMAVAGTGTTALVSGPSPASATVAGKSNATFTWRFTAGASGTSVQLTASAAGTDAVDLAPVATGDASAAVSFAESDRLFADPFGDGTGFAFLFEYAGKIWIGPRKDGNGALRFDPDGTNLQNANFSFARDSVANPLGSTSANTSPAPYPSIGATGCTANSPGCGPDNENGRGLFGAATLFGQEWLFVAGARSGASRLRYGYLTAGLGPSLDFSYLDMTPALEGNTVSVSAIHAFHDRLYVGLPDTGSDRPYLVALTRPPVYPGLDAVLDTDLLHLDGGNLPEIGHNQGNNVAVVLIDSMTDFNDRLYLFNNGGFARSTVPVPGRVNTNPGDWTAATPQGSVWNSRTSLTTAKLANLEPADKTTPQTASFNGRLFALRNTTAGPQLWSCDPAASGDATACDPGDWSLCAPNSTGDNRLTQFNNTNNSAATLLVATGASLLIGFNNATDGVVLFRTRAAHPLTMADFEGQAGCSAATAGCQGVGGNGLGDATAKRVFAAVAAPCRGRSYVYLAAGDGAGPVRIFRVDE